MKKVFMLVVLSLAFTIPAIATDDVFNASTVEAYSTGAKGNYLAGGHVSMEMGCVDCHGDTAKVDDKGTAMNESCMNCHSDMAGMAELSHENAKHSTHNAHEGHLKSIQCTTCHLAHEPSYAYCKNCHSFDDMRISYQNGFKPQFQIEDLTVYDDMKPNHVEKTDVLVIGAGGAGFTSAVNAHQNGAKVIIIEKMPIIGGNSQLAAGGMNVAGTQSQRDQGITEDSPEVHYNDTMKGGKNLNDPKLVRVLSNEAQNSLAWLDSVGAKLPHLSFSGGQTYKRVHTAKGGTIVGAYIISTLSDYAVKNGVDVRINTKAVKLLTNKRGDVIGARVNAKFGGVYDIMAESVVLATGGFGANNEMVGKYRPDLIGTTTSNQPGALGDGLALAESIGADFVDIDQIQIHPSVALNTKILISESVRGTGALLINKEGKRFVNEMRTRDQTSAAVLQQTGKTAFILFDDNTRAGMHQIEGYFDLGLVIEGKDLADLAKNMGVPADNLRATLDTYNEAIKNKVDKEFGRKDLDKTIGNGKVYAIHVAPGIHHTMGGVKINTKTQVINKKGKVIKNLYAAGEITGGVHGGNRLGGNAIADTTTFGRIAGTEAAKNAK